MTIQSWSAICKRIGCLNDAEHAYWTLKDNYEGYEECAGYAYKRIRFSGFPRSSMGNPSNWSAWARNNGYRVDRTPAVGAVIVWGFPAPWGHAAYIDDILPDGDLIISESNFDNVDMISRVTQDDARISQSMGIIHFADQVPAPQPVKVTNGDKFRVEGGTRGYVLAGGAPVYVSSWANVGGSAGIKTITQETFNALRRTPADGTYVTAGGRAYVFAGGAPIYISNWNNVGGPKPSTNIDPVAIAQAGGGADNVFANLNRTPADGTFLRGGPSGQYFRVASGKPTSINDAPSNAVVVDQATIDLVIGGGTWSAL